MTIPLLPGKYSIPTAPSFHLRRKRLDERWDSWARKQLVLVAAGAGFGKTSFLACNARRSARPVVWLNVDELDVDAPVFQGHLLHAFSRIAGGSSASSAGELHEPPGRLLASLVGILRDHGDGAVVVLDDVHVLIGHEEPVRFLELLIRNVPERTTVILASREPIDIVSMKRRIQGIADSMTARDLEFTADEVGELFRRHYPDRTLPERLCRRIRESTEGWAAGVEIVFQALAGPSEYDVENALERLSAAGSGWFSYFAEEVLSQLDAKSRTFLLASSILPRLDPRMCNQVLGINSSSAILNSLCDRNLFTFRTGEKRGDFRYHRLFREFLQEQFRRSTSSRRVVAFQKRAAATLERRGYWVESLMACAEAEDHSSALRLVRDRRERLLATGQFKLLEQAMGLLPEDRISGSFAATLFLGLVHDGMGRWREAMRSYEAAWRLHTARKDRTELLTRMAVLHIRWGEYAKGRELCRQALDLPGRKSPGARAPVQEMLGVAASELGFFDEAEHFIKEAGANWKRAGNIVQEAYTLSLLAANVHAPRGDFRKALALAQDAVATQSRLRDDRHICHAMSVLALLTAASLDEKSARSTARQALRLAEALGYRGMIGVCLHTLGTCALLAGEIADARARFEDCMHLADEVDETELSMLSRLGLARIELCSANLHAASRYAEDVLARASATGDRLQETQALLMLGMIQEKDGDDRGASDPRGASAALGAAEDRSRSRYGTVSAHPRLQLGWRKAEEIARSIGARFELHRALLLRLDHGDVAVEQEGRVLDELLTGSARMDHDRLFTVLEPERATTVLPRAVIRGIETSYALKMLVELGERAVCPLSELVSSCVESVRPAVIKSLVQIGNADAAIALSRLAATGTRSAQLAREAVVELETRSRVPLRISAFGALRIQVGDRELTHDAWRSRRALGLFQFLLVHRFRWIPREQILEALWPGVEESRASNSLRQTLHLLRGFLEPDLGKSIGSSYVQSRTEACRLAPGPGHTYDVEEFERLLAEGERHRRVGASAQAARSLEQAIEVYRGEFLGETPYVEFAAGEREHLRERMLGAIESLLNLHCETGRWKETIILARNGLERDPYRDTFHYGLIQAQFKLGNRKEALADYHRYEESIAAELDLFPDPAIRALADRIVAWGKRP